MPHVCEIVSTLGAHHPGPRPHHHYITSSQQSHTPVHLSHRRAFHIQYITYHNGCTQCQRVMKSRVRQQSWLLYAGKLATSVA